MDKSTLTIDIASIAEITARAGKPAPTPRYTFLSAGDMARMMTAGRWGIVEALTGAGPLGLRELARRVGRDIKGVHNDATALVANGLISRTKDGKLSFPYKRVRVQFEFRTLKAA